MNKVLLTRLGIKPIEERSEEWMREEQSRREVVRTYFQKKRAARGEAKEKKKGEIRK